MYGDIWSIYVRFKGQCICKDPLNLVHNISPWKQGINTPQRKNTKLNYWTTDLWVWNIDIIENKGSWNTEKCLVIDISPWRLHSPGCSTSPTPWGLDQLPKVSETRLWKNLFYRKKKPCNRPQFFVLVYSEPLEKPRIFFKKKHNTGVIWHGTVCIPGSGSSLLECQCFWVTWHHRRRKNQWNSKGVKLRFPI